jgi:DNA (cytosine-5)-methyltransferase 1
MLAADIESGDMIYQDSAKLNEIYNEATGAQSKVHKYHVLRKDKPSTTILAHLYKDGMRHIHPDSTQSRSITVREAARLQTFADDFEFLGPTMAQYKMIGNAVPSDFAKVIAEGLFELFNKYC